MITESAASSRAAPDRLFFGACVLILGISLLLTLGTHAALDGALRSQNAAAYQTRLGVETTQAAHRLIDTVDRVSATDPRSDSATGLREELHHDIARLISRDRLLRESNIARLAPSGQPEAETAARLLAPEIGVLDTSRLRALVAERLLPDFELATSEAAGRAAASGGLARTILYGSIALHLLLAGALLVLLILPTRRRIRDWVERSDQTQRETRFQLLHDPLTNLPNSTYLHAYIAQIASGAERGTKQTAVLRLDLDKFNMLRDTLGQRATDEIIRICARRLQQSLRGGDFAAYLGHDNFIVVANDLDDANAAAVIASRVQAALAKPFSIRGGARRIGCSIGVTLLSDDTPESSRVIANAEIALAEAQSAGPGSIRYFRESLRLEVERRETLYAELLTGLGAGQLVPFFQPQIDLTTGDFAGFEALVRWRHPRHGLLAPGAFLDFAEQTDLTERIGEVVLSQSLAALRAWDQAGLHVPRVGVNFALAQLRDPRLIEKIKWDVERHDIEPSRLAIEVLETVLIKSDADMVVRNLRGLASAGFHIELDDFGTGHASISNLRRFMVDRIKIDRGFILGIETSEEQQKLTASMIAMARALGIGTLAEGVETEAAEAMLRHLGCDAFQGFLVAKPMSLEETHDWLRGYRSRRGGMPNADCHSGTDPNIP